MIVLDASAILAFLQDEPGAARVEEGLSEGAAVGAANWSEVAQKVRSRRGEWEIVAGLLRGYRLQVEPVTAVDAEAAASLWKPASSLSLGDRLCLALGERLDAPVWTADREWSRFDRVVLIRG